MYACTDSLCDVPLKTNTSSAAVENAVAFAYHAVMEFQIRLEMHENALVSLKNIEFYGRGHSPYQTFLHYGRTPPPHIPPHCNLNSPLSVTGLAIAICCRCQVLRLDWLSPQHAHVTVNYH